GHD
ncbi:hypothetical protein TIFTF001_040099, partial [Ficus carica]